MAPASKYLSAVPPILHHIEIKNLKHSQCELALLIQAVSVIRFTVLEPISNYDRVQALLRNRMTN